MHQLPSVHKKLDFEVHLWRKNVMHASFILGDTQNTLQCIGTYFFSMGDGQHPWLSPSATRQRGVGMIGMFRGLVRAVSPKMTPQVLCGSTKVNMKQVITWLVTFCWLSILHIVGYNWHLTFWGRASNKLALLQLQPFWRASNGFLCYSYNPGVLDVNARSVGFDILRKGG